AIDAYRSVQHLDPENATLADRIQRAIDANGAERAEAGSPGGHMGGSAVPAQGKTPRRSQDSVVARPLQAAITEGDVYRDHGEYQKAIDIYRNALRLDPQNATLADRIRRTTNAMETERRQPKD